MTVALRQVLAAGVIPLILAGCSSEAASPSTTVKHPSTTANIVTADQQAFDNLLRQAQHDAFGGNSVAVNPYSSTTQVFSSAAAAMKAAQAAAKAAAKGAAQAAGSQASQLSAFSYCLTDVQSCQASRFSGKLKQDLLKLQAAEETLHRDEAGRS